MCLLVTQRPAQVYMCDTAELHLYVAPAIVIKFVKMNKQA